MKTKELLCLLAMLAAMSAKAGVITWTNTSGGNWSAGTNWSSGTVPGAADDVWITNAGTYTVTQDVAAAIARITLGGASGTQMLTNAGASLTLNGNSVVNSNGLLAFAGTLNGAGSLTVSGKLNWTAGNLRVPMSVTVSGVLELSGSADKGLTGALTNYGAIKLLGAGTLLFDPTFIDNRPGAVLDFQSDAALVFYSGAPFVTNAGTIRKSAGTGTNVISGVPLRNTGTLEVQTGTLFCSANGCFFGSGTQFKGAGANILGAGTVTLDGLISSENLVLGGATIIGTNTLSGTVQWTAGNIEAQGLVTIAAGSTLNLSGPAVKGLVGTLNNDGLVTWRGSGDFYMASSTFNNRAGGVFDAMKDGLIHWSGGNQPLFTNAGTFRKSAGTGTTLFSGVVVRNTGIVDAQTGTVTFNVTSTTFESGTQFLGAGTNLLSGGTITLNGSVDSHNLVWGGANIIGTNTLTGTVQWTAGNIEAQGLVTMAAGSTLNLSGPAVKGLVGTLNNDGLVTWSGGGDFHMASSTFNNRAGGVFDAMQDGLIHWSGGNQPLFTNAGLFRKSAGTGTTTVNNIPFVNTGTVDAQTGTIAFNATGSRFESGTRFLGAGTNLLAGGNVTLNGSIYSDNLVFGGSFILGTNTLSGTVLWTGSNIGDSGVVTVATNGTLNLTGANLKGINGVLNNRGTVRLSDSGTLAFASVSVLATLHNEPGGLVETLSDAPIAWTAYYPPLFTNAGTFRKSGGTGTTTVNGIPFVNTGTVDAQTGTIAFNTTGSRFESGTQFLGAGTNLLAGGNITLDGSIYSENLVFGGSFILGTNTLSGMVLWTAANIGESGAVTIATNGTLNLTGANLKGINGILNNQGTIRLSDSGVLAMASVSTLATIYNDPAGLFEMLSDAPIVWTAAYPPLFTNAGTFRKTGGTNFTDLSGVPFQNTGTVEVQSGIVRFLSAYTQTGGRLQFGLNSLTNFGQVQFAQTAPLTGTLGINLNGGYAPVAGNAFAVISYYPGYTGAFTGFELPTQAAWQTNTSIYGANAVTITVLNARPTVNPVTNKTTDEQLPLSFVITGSDLDAGQILTYALLNPPAGATIQTNSGLFAWTPTEAQGPSTNLLTVQVTDNGTPGLSATQQLTVVVNEVNLAPTLTVPPTQTLDELTPLTVTNLATDPDIPTNTLRFSLVAAPTGVNLNTNTGVLTWLPAETQGPSTNTLTIRVTDNGTPALSTTSNFTVVVREANLAPVLSAIPNLTHVAGAIRWFTNSASDPDVPVQPLTFSLLNAPPGMSIGLTSGIVVWGPPANSAPLTNTVTVRVSDSGSPPLTSQQSFLAVSIPVPSLRIARAAPGSVVLSWPAAATDAGFALESTTNLALPASWQTVAGSPVVISGDHLLTNLATWPVCAYRLVSALTPLPTLQIAATPSNTVLVSWTTTATAAGFRVQTAPGPNPSLTWNNATNPVGTSGSLNYIADPITDTQRCYRLQLVPPP